MPIFLLISVLSYGYADITQQLDLTMSFSNPPESMAKRILGFKFDLPIKLPYSYMEITGAEPFLLSGIQIETSKINWLKSFSIEYAKDYYLFPNKMIPLNEIGFEDLVCILFMTLAMSSISQSNGFE